MAEKPKKRSLVGETNARPDYVLMLIVITLLIIGLIMVYSSSFVQAYNAENMEPTHFLKRQAVWATLGLVIMALIMRIEYHKWQKFSIILMLGTLLLLVAVLLIGGTDGAGPKLFLFQRSIQPSEVCKFAMVVYIAHWLSSKGEKLRQVTYGLVPFAILIGTIAGLIVLEPDYGTAVLVVAVAAAMFFIGGADLIQLVISAIVGSGTLLLLIANSEHAWERVNIFLQDPFNPSLSSNTYQITRILVALGTGGITGVGLGSSSQKASLPAAHTDAIFAVLGQELGLIGCLAVVGLFAALAYRGFKIALRAEDSFGFILASGITIWLAFQGLINIGVVTDTLPLTGLPLPFISYGGSSLVISMMGVGTLLSISRGTGEKTKEQDAPSSIRGRHRRARVSDSGRRKAARK